MFEKLAQMLKRKAVMKPFRRTANFKLQIFILSWEIMTTAIQDPLFIINLLDLFTYIFVLSIYMVATNYIHVSQCWNILQFQLLSSYFTALFGAQNITKCLFCFQTTGMIAYLFSVTTIGLLWQLHKPWTLLRTVLFFYPEVNFGIICKTLHHQEWIL